MIDVAPDIDLPELVEMVEHCLTRHLFTVEEARVRLSADDMRVRPGAVRLRAILAER